MSETLLFLMLSCAVQSSISANQRHADRTLRNNFEFNADPDPIIVKHTSPIYSTPHKSIVNAVDGTTVIYQARLCDKKRLKGLWMCVAKILSSIQNFL